MILAIYGAHGLGQEINVIAKKINFHESTWDEIVFISDLKEDQDKMTNVYGFNDLTQKYSKQDVQFIIGVGEPFVRQKLYEKVKNEGFAFATLIHPGIYIDETTTIGEGVVVCEGCTITCNVRIGDNSYIQPHAVIGHDIKIGRHTVIGSNCQIGGANIIGDCCFFGFLSGTKEKISVGNDVIISAGGIVFRDLPDSVIAVGNPARIMKRNEEHKVFKL